MNPKPSLLPKVRFSCIFLQSYGNSIWSSLTNSGPKCWNHSQQGKTISALCFLGLHPRLCNPNIPANLTLYLHRVSHGSYFLTRTICVASLNIHIRPRFSSILSVATECLRNSPQIKWHGISIFLTKKEEKTSIFTQFLLQKVMLVKTIRTKRRFYSQP